MKGAEAFFEGLHALPCYENGASRNKKLRTRVLEVKTGDFTAKWYEEIECLNPDQTNVGGTDVLANLVYV